MKVHVHVHFHFLQERFNNRTEHNRPYVVVINNFNSKKVRDDE